METTCKVCGSPLPKRFRKFCSKTCRYKDTNQRNYEYQQRWQQNKRGEQKPGKLQCLFCGLWYVQIGTHTVQKHHTLAKDYKIQFDLPLNRGVVPQWYKTLKGELAIDNLTYKNLQRGKATRYVKGDPRAKEVTGWKGRRGNIGFTAYKSPEVS